LNMKPVFDVCIFEMIIVLKM